MRRAGKVTEPDHFERNRAIQTSLPGAINNSLPAASNFFDQLVVAKLLHRRRRTFSIDGRRIDIVVKRTECGLEHASTADSGFSEKLCATLATRLSDSGAHRRSASRAPTIYCMNFAHGLLTQHRDQVPQLILNVAGRGHCVADLFPQQSAITLTKTMISLFDRVLGHS
jgi:hypothetical protein